MLSPLDLSPLLRQLAQLNFVYIGCIRIRASSNNGLRLCRSHVRELFQILGGSGVDIRRPFSGQSLAIAPASRLAAAVAPAVCC